MNSGASVADAAYQGAPGAFSEEAALALVGASASLLPCRTLEDVFSAVCSGSARSAVVPVENTLAGAVPGCVDLIGRHDVHIVAERVQLIAHALIGAPGSTLQGLRRVWSHPVALAQCEEFLRAHPDITPVPMFDTAGAVAEVMQHRAPEIGAIAGSRAAAIHGAVVLAEDIQDSSENFTRFLLLEPGPAGPPLRAAWKTSVLCTLRNEPGALMRALEPLARHSLNLSRIESRPIRETPFEYRFYLDVTPQADASLQELAAGLAALERRTRSFRVLGHYPPA